MIDVTKFAEDEKIIQRATVESQEDVTRLKAMNPKSIIVCTIQCTSGEYIDLGSLNVRGLKIDGQTSLDALISIPKSVESIILERIHITEHTLNLYSPKVTLIAFKKCRITHVPHYPKILSAMNFCEVEFDNPTIKIESNKIRNSTMLDTNVERIHIHGNNASVTLVGCTQFKNAEWYQDEQDTMPYSMDVLKVQGSHSADEWKAFCEATLVKWVTFV